MATAIPTRRRIRGHQYAVRECNGSPGWTVQRFYPELGRLWFDASDPCTTVDEANAKLEAMPS